MRQPDDQRHHVLGQLVLGLRASRLLSDARDVDYDVDEHGAILVSWTAGPFPGEVAAGLIAYAADTGFLTVAGVARPSGSVVRAKIVVGGVPVVLHATEAIGLQHVRSAWRFLREGERWGWPEALERDGAARDAVLWDRDPRRGLVATVVRSPIDTLHDDWWAEDGFSVAVAEDEMPAELGAGRRSEVAAFRRGCSILLRSGREWTREEADEWMTSILNHPNDAPGSVAVLWPGVCVLRRASGLTMRITPEESDFLMPASYVPAAVLGALFCEMPRREPPTSLTMRAYGQQWGIGNLTIESTWAAPSWLYAARQPLASLSADDAGAEPA